MSTESKTISEESETISGAFGKVADAFVDEITAQIDDKQRSAERAVLKQGRFDRASQEQKGWVAELTEISERLEELTGGKFSVSEKTDERNGQFSAILKGEMGGEDFSKLSKPSKLIDRLRLPFFATMFRGNDKPRLAFSLTLSAGTHTEEDSSYKLGLETVDIDAGFLTKGSDFDPDECRDSDARHRAATRGYNGSTSYSEDPQWANAKFTEKKEIDAFVKTIFGNLCKTKAFKYHAEKKIRKDAESKQSTVEAEPI